MKKIAIFFTLAALAFLLGGCYVAPMPYPAVRAPRMHHHPAPRVYRYPVVAPAPRVIAPLPPPIYYYR
ncbi:MAG: hypothetical protein D3908_06855 [Candidatus Electrothrix sp. AUS4]|nr:hypothetical protein [Candidatus Electrothrix sp. AUS4]